MRICFVVNGAPGGALDTRVRGLSAHWRDDDVRIHFRAANKVAGVGRFVRQIAADHPDVVCVVDTSYTGVLAAAFHRGLRPSCPVVLDTGDAVAELGRSLGRSPLGILATDALESFAHRTARRIVVRGTFHRELLLERGLRHVDVVRDGVDTEQVRPRDGAPVRERLGLGPSLVVGVLGSLTWNPRYQLVYGWDLVEALAALRELDVRGLVVGDGDGEPKLRDLARRLGVEDRLAFTGRVPMSEIGSWLAAADVWLSTQTNDVPGRVRTTGKLPLYMAAGRFVIATDVGEAKLLLPDAMRLPYSGIKDPKWPRRLAERIRQLVERPSELALARGLREVAVRELDYAVLSSKFRRSLEEAVAS